MKKSLLTLSLSLAFAVMSFAQNVSVTFQVSNPDSLPVYVFGSWSGWSDWPGTQMTSVGNGVYEATLSLNGSSTYEYLYVNGATVYTKETLDPTWPCTNGNGQYTNRVINVGTSNMSICSNWSSCSLCGTVSNDVTYTFQVSSPDSLPVYVFGSWNNWYWPGTPMTSIGNGVYSATIPLTKSTAYEYLFVNGATAPVKEALDPAWPCTNGNGQYTNRTLQVGVMDSTICHEWASCNTCTGGPASANITFRVESPDSTPVYVFGSWSNWSNFPGTPMTSIGNNAYEVTLTLGTNQAVEYLFVNGVGTKEILNPADPCTNGNGQYTNRVANIGSTDMMLCGVWETCNTCATIGVNTVLSDKLSVNISQQGVMVQSNSINTIDQIEVYDVLGRNVYYSNNPMSTNNLIPVEFNANSIYFIKVKAQGQTQTYKGLIIE